MHTFVARVGFAPTIPVFERAKTFRALERAATVIGVFRNHCTLILALLTSAKFSQLLVKIAEANTLHISPRSLLLGAYNKLRIYNSDSCPSIYRFPVEFGIGPFRIILGEGFLIVIGRLNCCWSSPA
jgi:hypothetical protein